METMDADSLTEEELAGMPVSVLEALDQGIIEVESIQLHPDEEPYNYGDISY